MYQIKSFNFNPSLRTFEQYQNLINFEHINMRYIQRSLSLQNILC